MNKERWSHEENLERLALKLNEEAGEVAKAVIDLPKTIDTPARAHLRLEVRHVIFIAMRIMEALDV